MSKIYILALLFYNIVIAISSPTEYDTYYDLEADKWENLVRLLEYPEVKHRNVRTRTTEPPWLEHWTGRWMPEHANDPTPPPKVWPSKDQESHNVDMGIINNCDDGLTNLTVDWDKSPVNHTCFNRFFRPNFDSLPIIHSEIIPPAYKAFHRCMNETIEYDDVIPVYGTHRPAWPTYGEYRFLPRQRWIHSLEHGAVVMLYHPCAHPTEVGLLKKLVKQCLRRYIISPYNLLDKERPLALVAWGAHLTMSYASPNIVMQFIKEKALQGPEQIPDDGRFTEGLLSKSKNVSDFDDSNLCPYV